MKKLLLILLCLPMIGFGQKKISACECLDKKTKMFEVLIERQEMTIESQEKEKNGEIIDKIEDDSIRLKYKNQSDKMKGYDAFEEICQNTISEAGINFFMKECPQILNKYKLLSNYVKILDVQVVENNKLLLKE